MKRRIFLIACQVVILFFLGQSAFAQPTEFTYQGRLLSGTLPANGSHDFEFSIWNADTGGSQIGSTVTLTDVNVNNGVFSVLINFGNVFTGENRFLEIKVRQSGTGTTFTALTPRQAITSAPYSIKSINAENANNASQLGGIASNRFVLTTDARLFDPRNPLPNSSNYIQNSFFQQSNSRFNISGDGTSGGTLSGNIVNAATQFNMGGNRVLKTDGNFNLFTGILSGTNTTGGSNSFFGFLAGASNTSGSFNSYFGRSANGLATITNATAIGALAQVTQSNSLVLGSIQGVNGASANTNVGIGTTSPDGAFEVVSTPGRPVFFSQYSSNQGPRLIARLSRGTKTSPSPVFAGTSLFEIGAEGDDGTGFDNFPAAAISFEASENWTSTGNGSRILFSTTKNKVVGTRAVWMVIENNGFVGIGDVSPSAKLTVGGEGAFNSSSAARFDLFNHSAQVGYFQHVFDDGRWQLGTGSSTRILVEANGNVGIGTGAADKLQVAGNIRIGTGSNGCVKDADATVIAGSCSSDARLKQLISSFSPTLDRLIKLRPVHFFWRTKEFPEMAFGERQSYGLIAQEVEEVLPELVSEDEQGFKTVNYSKLPLLMLQAIKELKSENDSLKQEMKQINQQEEIIRQQQTEINALKKLVCSQNPTAELCQPKN